MKVVALLAMTAVLSLGQTECARAADALDRLKACAEFQGTERLKCVDGLLEEMNEESEVKAQRPNWIISETTSPVDYRPQVSALITAPASSQDAPAAFAIHCRAQRTELIVSTTGVWNLPKERDVKVVYRVNEEPSVEQRWKSAESGKILAFPGDVVGFLRSIPEGGRILVQVYAGKSQPNENTFQLAGLDRVRRKVAAACNWPQS
jgi:hypothetical protein